MGDATTLVNVVQRLGGAVGAMGLAALLVRAGGAGARVRAIAVLTLVSVVTLFTAETLRRRPASKRLPDGRSADTVSFECD